MLTFSSFFYFYIAMKRSVIIFSLLITSLITFGQYNYGFNAKCKDAYNNIISLKFEEGRKLLDEEKSIHPGNNIPFLLENYIYFLTVFISEQETTFDSLKESKNIILDQLKAGDENSPYYRYCLAQVYLQWAFARTKFKEYVPALLEINKAYRLLGENDKEYPDFLPNMLNLGLLHTLIGTVPDNYNWVKNLVGVEGTVDQGVNEILTVLDATMKKEEYSQYKAECLFYLSFIQMNLSANKQKALGYIKLIEKDSSGIKSPLAIYAISRIYMANGMNDKAIDLLLSRPKGPEYFPFYYLDYLTGIVKLRRLDNDAITYFNKYIENFKGLNFIKDAFQKIAWYYLVNNNLTKYKEYMDKVKLYGNTIVDADKQAEREAEKNRIPNIYLLRARLLSDGGYYQNALMAITGNTATNFLRNSADSLEFTYRIGRIYHDWDKPQIAIPFYQQTIDRGLNQNIILQPIQHLSSVIFMKIKAILRKRATIIHWPNQWIIKSIKTVSIKKRKQA